MSENISDRRRFVKNLTGGIGFLSLPAILNAKTESAAQKYKIVCVGGHPDDPESGCGGTIAKCTNAGHEVTVVYLTTGEAGVKGRPASEAALIRKQEAINACSILNAKPIFAGQVNGDIILNNEWITKMHQIIATEKPDIVLTHWPIDTHRDHQVASILTIQALLNNERKFSLYFFEVCSGEQTIGFHPTDYIDITDTQQQKRKAVYCHVSQDPPGIYDCGHTSMEEFRGREAGVKAGEAFVRFTGKDQGGIMLQQIV